MRCDFADGMLAPNVRCADDAPAMMTVRCSQDVLACPLCQTENRRKNELLVPVPRRRHGRIRLCAEPVCCFEQSQHCEPRLWSAQRRERHVQSDCRIDVVCGHGRDGGGAGREGRAGREGVRRSEMRAVPLDRRQGQQERAARRRRPKLKADEIREWIVDAKGMTAKTKAHAQARDEGVHAAERGRGCARRVHGDAEEVAFDVAAFEAGHAHAVSRPVDDRRPRRGRRGRRRARGSRAPKPPANDDCLACHGDADAKRANGTPVAVDAPAFAASKHGPMACVDCHADLATLTEFPHPDTLKKVNCASCHDDDRGDVSRQHSREGAGEIRAQRRARLRRLSRPSRHPGQDRSEEPRVARAGAGDVRRRATTGSSAATTPACTPRR